MARETELERQRRLAAENDQFEAWRQAYQQEQDLSNLSGGLINGRPAADVVDVTTIDPARPPLPDGERRDRASRTVSNPDEVMRNAERISAQRKADQDANAAVVANSYDQFLADRRIDPQTIGDARLFTDASGNRRMSGPTVDEQYAAVNLQNRLNGVDARNRIAARRLGDRNPGLAASMMNDLSFSTQARGGRSSEDRRAVALQALQSQADRLRRDEEIRARQRAQSNGFNSGIGPRRYWDRVANIA